jgi:hypothetical protein
MPLGSSLAPGAPQEVSLVSFPLPLRARTCQPLSRRLPPASAHGALPLVKRLQALLALAQGPSISAVAERRSRGEPTVRASRHLSLFQGRASWVDQAPPGRPSPRTTPTARRASRGAKRTPKPRAIPREAGPRRGFRPSARGPGAWLRSKPGWSPRTSMRPNAARGVTPDGPRGDARPNRARPWGSWARWPVWPRGARGAPRGHPQASTPMGLPAAHARPPTSWVALTLCPGPLAPRPPRGVSPPRAPRRCGSRS